MLPAGTTIINSAHHPRGNDDKRKPAGCLVVGDGVYVAGDRGRRVWCLVVPRKCSLTPICVGRIKSIQNVLCDRVWGLHEEVDIGLVRRGETAVSPRCDGYREGWIRGLVD